MAGLLKVFKIVLIIAVTLVTDIQMRANAVSRNEKRPISRALPRRWFVTANVVTETGMTSPEDDSTLVGAGSLPSMEQQFLGRLGMETLPSRRYRRSKATKDAAIPGYLTEILRKFQRQTRKNWNAHKQQDKETIVTGVMPYRGRTPKC